MDQQQTETAARRATDLFDELTTETYYGFNFRCELVAAMRTDPVFVDRLEAFVAEARKMRES